MSLSRRTFHQTLAGAAASAFVASAQTGRKIGYCIIGLGRISMNEFMPGVRLSQNSRITGIVSGHREKAEKVAREYGVPAGSIYSYQDMDKISANAEIDAVYVALPNNMHAEYTIRAAKAGKHVLCEKPMAVSAAECRQMIAACKTASRKLMIAYRLQYEPNNLKAQQAIREGRIGRLQLIDASFGFNIQPGEWRLSKKMAGGGPLMDVGIYALQACRMMTGENPTEIHARWDVIDKDGRFNEVEENLVWTMRFPSGVMATCNTSYGTGTTGYYRAYGSTGSVIMEPAFAYDGLKLSIRAQGKPPGDDSISDPNPRQFLREADHLADCILNGGTPKSGGEEGLRDLTIMEAIYRSCRSGQPVTLAGLD